jgi:hypothetical protein
MLYTMAYQTMPTIVYWYSAFIQNRNKRNQMKKIRHKPRVFSNTQHSWQRCRTQPHCRTIFPISDFLFKPPKIIGGALKFLKF